MAKHNTTTTTEATEVATKTAVAHSPATVLIGKCRLAAIAAIAEFKMPVVAKAYADQAEEFLIEAQGVAADDIKDNRQLEIGQRWVTASAAVVA